ncbi:MAG: SDR family NAD(P)-dependent oxidoreductase [Bilifractor sp.]|jgi:short-subunit dehydrogenase
MRIALITGASSGMGAEFAKQIDRTEKDIDEIWLLARRKQRLEEIASGLRHRARAVPMDMTDDAGFEKLEKTFRQEKIQVGILVNCAGYGKLGNYQAVSRFDSLNMIDLNCRAAVSITLSCLPYMKAGDRIIQICSTAAFQPLQQVNIYSASKAFLYNYTRALRMELLPRRIAVLAVCPYWIRDTEFIGIAEKTGKETGQEKNRPLRHYLLANTTAAQVAKRALRCSRRGYAVCTPGVICTLDRIFGKLLPREAMMYIWEGLRRI